MGVDDKIEKTIAAVADALNASGLTFGIMRLILKDVLSTVEAQIELQKIKKADDGGKEGKNGTE